MIDQSHNLKGKIEAMVQTVVTAQELWLKAALVDREQLGRLSAILRPGRRRRALPRRILDAMSAPDRRLARIPRPARRPLAALRASGYVERIAASAEAVSAVNSYA
jgi:L-rhamnose isomerase / sugar isomerase